MRSNRVRIRYDRDELLEVLGETFASALDEYEKRRAEGRDKPCQSEVWHGPGHQSSTFCELRGPHTGHFADLPSGGFAEWTDKDPYARDY